MNWKLLFNPWGEIRRLREANAFLEGRCEQIEQWAEDAEARAFHAAADHYWQRNRMIEAQLKHTQEQFMNVVNLQPPSIIATMQGAHFKAP